MTKYLWS